MDIISSAFEPEDTILQQYTCDGENINPPLEFVDVPLDAKSLVLIVDDPDSPTHVWSHWVLFNIPATTLEIAEGETPEGARVGVNDFGNKGYGGPCPADGEHRYLFKLIALDSMLDLPEGATKDAVEDAMEDHIIEQAELTGTYSRDTD